MTVSYLFHIRCTAIAQFDGVSVKYFPQFVANWKTCVDKADERYSYIRFNVSVKRLVKPYDISTSVLLIWWSLCCGLELKFEGVTALV